MDALLFRPALTRSVKLICFVDKLESASKSWVINAADREKRLVHIEEMRGTLRAKLFVVALPEVLGP